MVLKAQLTGYREWAKPLNLPAVGSTQKLRQLRGDPLGWVGFLGEFKKGTLCGNAPDDFDWARILDNFPLPSDNLPGPTTLKKGAGVCHGIYCV